MQGRIYCKRYKGIDYRENNILEQEFNVSCLIIFPCQTHNEKQCEVVEEQQCGTVVTQKCHAVPDQECISVPEKVPEDIP